MKCNCVAILVYYNTCVYKLLYFNRECVSIRCALRETCHKKRASRDATHAIILWRDNATFEATAKSNTARRGRAAGRSARVTRVVVHVQS